MSTAQPFETTLREIVNHLVTDYKPAQIILFGSFARNDAHGDSDIDLLIIKETDESPLERRVHVRRLVAQPERRIPFSPLVLTPVELEQRLALGDPFYRDILRQGKVLYARY
jgi:predicted nucleotidyltransferase